MREGSSAVVIRDATPDDAEAACAVLRASITRLCMSDHLDNLAVLERWLRNKTPEHVKSWVSQPGNSVLLAVRNEEVLAVGAVNDQGEITLNYVLPSARFQGVSRKLLAALEARAAERGHELCTLSSTATARRFYLAAGYVETRPPTEMFGTPSYPMAKRIKG